MSLIHAIVLGIVQGLTEFLPISSSGHLLIIPWLFGWQEDGGLPFEAALHLGTLLAVVTYFWRDLLRMALALPRVFTRPGALLGTTGADSDHDARLALLIAIGTVPGVIVGLTAESAIDSFFHAGQASNRAVAVIACTLIGLGLLLWLAERSATHERRLRQLTWRDALIIGIAQATALIPGVSRSGATLTAALFQGLHRADAARFSFLLGTPIVLGAGLKGVANALQAGMTSHEVLIFVAGGLTSAVVGFVAIWGLLRFLQRSSTLVFVIYRVALGLLLLGVLAARA